MSCEEELIRRLCAALVGDVAPDLIRLISGRLSEALNDYEVTPKTKDLVPRADALPKSVLGASELWILATASHVNKLSLYLTVVALTANTQYFALTAF